MDRRSSPCAPGAGFPPPELAGRDDIVEGACIALDRVKAGRAARSFIFCGLRGVGNTTRQPAFFSSLTAGKPTLGRVRPTGCVTKRPMLSGARFVRLRMNCGHGRSGGRLCQAACVGRLLAALRSSFVSLFRMCLDSLACVVTRWLKDGKSSSLKLL